MTGIFQDGGLFLWPLLACALTGFVIIVWKFLSLGGLADATRVLLREVDDLISGRRIEEIGICCRDSDTPAAAILLAGLARRDQGAERVGKAIEHEGLLQAARLESGVAWLGTIARVAPLIGFLGMVVGVIAALGTVETGGETNAARLADGVRVALIPAAAGLAIAIPVTLARDYFAVRIERFVVEMEDVSRDLMRSLEVSETPHVPRVEG